MFTLKFFRKRNRAFYREVISFDSEWSPENFHFHIVAQTAQHGETHFYVAGHGKPKLAEEDFRVCFVLNDVGRQVERIGYLDMSDAAEIRGMRDAGKIDRVEVPLPREAHLPAASETEVLADALGS